MSRSFVNNYWSSDYKTGINKLSLQSLKSLKQLNDLSFLLNQYIGYFNTNSNNLNRISIESFQLDNGFRDIPTNEDNESGQDNLNNRIQRRISSTLLSIHDSINSIDLNNSVPAFDATGIEEEYSGDGGDTSEVSKETPPPSRVMESLLTIFEKHIERLSEESYNFQDLSATIDKTIKHDVDEYLRLNQSKINNKLNEFKKLLKNYEVFYNKTEKFKLEYFELLRLQEIYDNENQNFQPRKDSVASIDEERKSEPHNNKFETPKKSIISSPTKSQSSPYSLKDLNSDLDLDFPVKIGYSQFSSTELLQLLKRMILEIPTQKRKFPIPGYSNLIFQSEELSNWLIKNRPKTEGSRLQVEKFGQNLVDLKFIIGTGFLSKKFKSSEMWFEWSDLAKYIANYVENTTENINNSNEEIPLTEEKIGDKFKNLPSVVIEESPKAVKTASMKINNVLNNFKTTVMKTNYIAQLEIVEPKYFENYFNLQEHKNLLDTSIIEFSKFFESFEKNKVKLIYNSLTRLSQLLHNYSLESTKKYHQLSTLLVTNNTTENYDFEFNKMIDKYSSGIYFPSNLPINFNKNSVNHNHNDTYQNLKLKFNLYSDISLQLTLEADTPTTKSIPIIFYSIIELLNIESETSNSLDQLWRSPLNHYEYWRTKEKLIELISDFDATSAADLDEQNGNMEDPIYQKKILNIIKTKEKEIHQQLIKEIIKFLSNEDKFITLNFLKLWLLELSDSLLPFIIFDAIVKNYDRHNIKNSIDRDLRRKELVKILSTIPRNNLSSLIFLLEHLANVSNLKNLENYYYETNDLNKTSNIECENEIPDYIKSLNSMDTICGIPFIHLILRPSKIKHSAGFKPNIDLYNTLLFDLLNYDTRKKLLDELIIKENNFLIKKEQELSGIKLQVKKFPPTTPKVTNKRLSGSRFGNTPVNSDGIALRPFRTGTTPNPSPGNSPIHTPKLSSTRSRTNSLSNGPNDLSSIDSSIPTLNINKSRHSQAYDNDRSRNRSSSFLLAPPINVEYEQN